MPADRCRSATSHLSRDKERIVMRHIRIAPSAAGPALVIGVALVLSACSGAAPAAPSSDAPQAIAMQGTVWVADEYGGSITVIDAATNKIATTLTGIEGPPNLQVAPDGKSVWAVSGHDAMAVMIDATTYAVHGAVATGKEPAHIILTPNGRTAYATNGDDNTVTAIDTAPMEVIATIPVGEDPHGFGPRPRAQR